MPFEPWPRRADREQADASWPPRDEQDDEQVDEHNREVPTSTWPGDDREHGEHSDEHDEHEQWGDEFNEHPSPWQEWRRAVAEQRDYAVHAAYTKKTGWRRNTDVIYAYTLGTGAISVGRGLEMCFGHGIARAALSVFAAIALGWGLNHLPVISWLIPDAWDITQLWAPDPDTVTVPLDAVSEG